MALTKVLTGGIADDAVTTAKVNPSQTDITAVGTLTSLTVDGAAALKLDANYPVGTGNVGLGNNALNGSISGTYNTAIGDHSMAPLTSGYSNTACGGSALRFITSGYSNSAFGHSAMQTNLTGIMNNAVGHTALYGNTTGTQNTAIGHRSMFGQTTGVGNSAIGIESGTGLTTGAYNVLLGRYSGKNITTGAYNVTVGNDNSTSAVAAQFQVVIGHGMVGKGDGTAIIAGQAYQSSNASTWFTVSDKRIKKNIVDNNDGLNAINQIQVKNFEYRTEDEITDFDNPKSAVVNKQGVQLGVIAQEIQSILPDMVKEETTGVLSVNPDNMTWHLVNAVKELSAQVNVLTARISELEEK